MASNTNTSKSRPSLLYFLASPFFVVNALTLLPYPIARLRGMRQLAFSMASESVSGVQRRQTSVWHGAQIFRGF